MMSTFTFDALVVGAGIAGLAAARCAAQCGLETASIEAQMFGGLVLNIAELDPPLQGRMGSGADLASNLMSEAIEAGVVNIPESVVAIEAHEESIQVQTSGDQFTAKTVVLASGARLKSLGIPGEAEFQHRGVAHCADCDGAFYAGRDVAVVGGGDSALQEALVLSRHCRRVFIVHRHKHFRAKSRFVESVQRLANIHLLLDTTLREICGGNQVEAVIIRNRGTGRDDEIPCSGVFPYIGLEPNAQFVPANILRDERGFVLTNKRLSTSVPHIYAIGAVRSGFGGSLDDAFADAGVSVASLTK